jgi:hypothetical protein
MLAGKWLEGISNGNLERMEFIISNGFSKVWGEIWSIVNLEYFLK